MKKNNHVWDNYFIIQYKNKLPKQNKILTAFLQNLSATELHLNIIFDTKYL